MDIKTALTKLDPSNDDHWTADGAPRIDAVVELTGDKSIKRQDITNAAPKFNREAAAKENSDADDTDNGREGQGPEQGPGPSSEKVAEDPSSEEPSGEEAKDDGIVPKTEEQRQADATREAEEARERTGLEKGDFGADGPAPGQQAMDKTELDNLQEQLADATKEMLEAQRVAEEAKQEADLAADKVNNLNRAIERLQKADPNYATAGIRKYIDQQNKNRLKRASGLHRFIEQTGVHPADVNKAVDPKAPIDRAMSQRKPVRGSLRPNYARSG